MKILLCGATGMLGQELEARLSARDVDVLTPKRAALDLTSARDIATFVAEHRPTHVLNAAAYTAVDKAETEESAAHALNGVAPGHLAAAAHSVGAHLVHVSTDYVFDGRADHPYVEDDEVAPLGAYGSTKLEGERAVLAAHDEAAVVRTAWVFGAGGNNFVKTMLRLMKEREGLRVVADQRGRPTAAGDLADAVLALAGLDDGGEPRRGIFHFCNADETTWHGFATAILDDARARGAQLACRQVDAITTADYPTPAARPAYSVLSTAHYTDVTGRIPRPWREALGEVLDQLVA